MDIYEIRFQNYRRLVEKFLDDELKAGNSERGLLARFGAKTEISPRYLSHVNNGRKQLGDDACRRMEQAFGMPYSWMDNDHSATVEPKTKQERDFIAFALDLFRRSPVEAQFVLLAGMKDGR